MVTFLSFLFCLLLRGTFSPVSVHTAGNRKKKKNMLWPEAETSHVPDDTDTCTVGYGVSVGDTPVVLQGERVGAGEGGHLRSPGASLSITALQAEKNNTQLHVSH